MKHFEAKFALLHIAICAVISWAPALLFNGPFWIYFLAISFAMIVNGFIAEKEDRREGGFVGPDKADSETAGERRSGDNRERAS